MGLVSYGMMWGSWSGGGLVARPGLRDNGYGVTTLGGDAAASIGGGYLLSMGYVCSCTTNGTDALLILGGC